MQPTMTNPLCSIMLRRLLVAAERKRPVFLFGEVILYSSSYAFHTQEPFLNSNLEFIWYRFYDVDLMKSSFLNVFWIH
jgi:hypothetical protein